MSAQTPPFSQGWISLTPDEETSLSSCEPELTAEPISELKQAWEGKERKIPDGILVITGQA